MFTALKPVSKYCAMSGPRVASFAKYAICASTPAWVSTAFPPVAALTLGTAVNAVWLAASRVTLMS